MLLLTGEKKTESDSVFFSPLPKLLCRIMEEQEQQEQQEDVEAEMIKETRASAKFMGEKWAGGKKLEWENWVIVEIVNLDPIFAQLQNLEEKYSDRSSFMLQQAQSDSEFLKPTACEDFNKRHDLTYMLSLPFRQKPKGIVLIDYIQGMELSVPWVPDGRGANSLFAAVLAQLAGVPTSYTPVMMRIQMVDYYTKNAETIEVNSFINWSNMCEKKTEMHFGLLFGTYMLVIFHCNIDCIHKMLKQIKYMRCCFY